MQSQILRLRYPPLTTTGSRGGGEKKEYERLYIDGAAPPYRQKQRRGEDGAPRFVGLFAGAGDVFVLDFLRLFGLIAGEVVGVPAYAFAGHFRMLAQELQGILRG